VQPDAVAEPTEPCLPDYTGAGLAGVVPALLGRAPREWLPEPVADARSVLLLVLDGLGWNALATHGETLPVLSGLVGGPVPTVVPSTTATALTSLTTGVAPARHGLVGFRVRVDGSVLNLLSWQQTGSRRAPDPVTLQRHAPFLGRDIPVVTKSEFRGTGFSAAHLRGARFFGWPAVSSMVEQCRRLVAEGEPLVYAYYPGVDSVAHAHGLLDGFYAAELAAVDRLVDDVLRALPPSAALLVTSDHGQVHVGPDGWFELGPARELVELCSGDGRFRYLHARPGAARELHAAMRTEHGGRAWVLSREELLDAGWLGPDPSGATRGRVGDVLLAARGPVAFVDPALPREAHLVSAHGSLTPAEMQVPLVAGRGRAPS
jgi:hypothetical protein